MDWAKLQKDATRPDLLGRRADVDVLDARIACTPSWTGAAQASVMLRRALELLLPCSTTPMDQIQTLAIRRRLEIGGPAFELCRIEEVVP